MERTLAPVLAAIREGRISPVYLLHGDEGFLIDRSRRAIVDALVETTGAEAETVDARDSGLGDVLERAAEVSLFSTRRIVVVRQAQHLTPVGAAELDLFRGLCETRGSEDNVIVLAGGQSLDKRTRFYKTLASVGTVLVFDVLKGRALPAWVVEEAAGRGFRIGKQALDALLARTGNSLRQIDLELEKLTQWVGPRKEIEPGDVEAVVPRSKEDVIFELTGALGERKVQDALKSLRELRFRGSTPLMILSMLGREVRFLLQAKLMEGAVEGAGWNERVGFDSFVRTVWPRVKDAVEPPAGNPRYHLLGANPYVAFLVLRRARQFSRAELEHGLARIGRTDLVLKSTTQSPDALLERLVIELARPCEESWAGRTS